MDMEAQVRIRRACDPGGAYHEFMTLFTSQPCDEQGTASPPAARDDAFWYAALLARDARFDGRIFVAVTSTGIYCRPVCRVRTPLRRNCQFYPHAAAAEAAGFRPCLRCRPELAPGLARVDAVQTLAGQAALLLDSAAARGQPLSMPELAARLGVSDRHLRRIFAESLGVAPLAYLNTRRLLQAKQMLSDTPLPITSVALATGFGSLRRFNTAFATHYRLNPSQLRKQAAGGGVSRGRSEVQVRLGYRPPYDISGMRLFLRARAVPGLEHVADGTDGLSYTRSLAIAGHGHPTQGWIRADFNPARNEVQVTLSDALLPVIGTVLERLRQSLDLDADPALIDPVVARLGLAPCDGLRLPAAVDGFEAAVRVILGQQVSVAAARTLTARLVRALGEPISTPLDAVTHVFPSPQVIARAAPEVLGLLGIVRQRVGALQALARAVADGSVSLDRNTPMEKTLAALRQLPGIGEWTVQLIAMRVLAWPDAFPATDLGVLKALGTQDSREAIAKAEAWRPWRAYAVMRLWQTLEKPHEYTHRSTV